MTRYDELVGAVREAAGARAWGAAVKLSRDGAVVGISDDGEEVHLRVKGRGKAVPFDVYLWPADPDWGCDCGQPGDACLHVAAAAISVSKQPEDDVLPEPSATHAVTLAYAFVSKKAALSVSREIVFRDGRRVPMTKPLAKTDVLVERSDAQAESLLAIHPGGPLPAETLRALLAILESGTDATLDGKPVKIQRKPIPFEVRVTDSVDGFKVGLYRPGDIDALFRGAAVRKGKLAPTSHGDLTVQQRQMLLKGVHFRNDEVARLVSDYLPVLRERIPVKIQTERLPTDEDLTPRVQVVLREKNGGLSVEPRLVYGDPPVARITPGGALERIGDAVVAGRDLSTERATVRRFEARIGLNVGYTHQLGPEEAAAFLDKKLKLHDGPVVGSVDAARFRIERRTVVPNVDVRQEGKAWHLDVSFSLPGEDDQLREADPRTVLDAWRRNRSLVPLMDGGYAPLPTDWLAEHGAILRELLDGRDSEGKVERHATAALVELLEGTKGQVPPDLKRLREWLEGADGLPDVEIPAGLNAELRGYQKAGLQWMKFLRQMELSGILADDMGLGKTVQALAAMLDAGGRSLVIAPTSVLRNWEAEAKKFAPGMTVNVYHGPGRQLDDADLTITSYALLRLDLELLREVNWTYAVLDEAQAIKNPSSQTARSAGKLRAINRLALTGTPVENRLEELWSLFRFLMPGLLGSLESFKERFVRPIENANEGAQKVLRARVRPYVLRRMKRQVATELPPLTEMVLRCPLSAEQRKVYDAVRLAAREDVQRALTDGQNKGPATFQVLEALLRMRQACCDPALLPGDIGDGVAAAKLDRLEDLLIEVILEDHKALVFSQWTGLLDRVELRLKKLDIDWVRLDGSTRDRQSLIDRFQSDEGPPVFLLSLKAGGTGLNLTAADYVIHLDPWWNPAVEQQATDRAHRIGQTKPVVSYKLIAEHTVEERILELQATKRDLAEAAIGTEGGFIKGLSASELRSLFEAAM